MTRSCRELRAHVVELVEGDLDAALAARLRAHAESCADCRREVRLEEELVSTLRTPFPVPSFLVSVPDADARPARRLRLTTAAAAAALSAAAAVIVAVAVSAGPAFDLFPDVDGEAVGADRTVRIRTVVESSADVPLPDDDLLALTAGVEAVVMRRPAVGR